MKEQTQALEHASVKQYCKALRVPMIGAHFVQLAEQAIKEQRSHIGYLEALLTMESEERDRHAIQQRLRDAKLPRLKTLEEFDFNQARQIPAAKIRELAEGGYIERAEPVVLMGESGTGKTHLATGLCVTACRQKRRARFTTAANLGGSPATQRGETSAGALVALRRDRARRSRLRAAGRHRSGVFVPSDRRTRRAGYVDRDHEPAVFRMDAGVSQSALVQGVAGSNHGPSAHHRNRRRVLSLSQNLGGASEKESIVGGCF